MEVAAYSKVRERREDISQSTENTEESDVTKSIALKAINSKHPPFLYTLYQKDKYISTFLTSSFPA